MHRNTLSRETLDGSIRYHYLHALQTLVLSRTLSNYLFESLRVAHAFKITVLRLARIGPTAQSLRARR